MDDSSPEAPQNCKKIVKHSYWLLLQGTSSKFLHLMHLMSFVTTAFA